ncbi:hypothetical protein BC834DRAFT_21318 [Gloeopeniophorella convolvens]|nr:hypothetical protein BC834DRAFT_21318 [Gloeopeniophorella convolvens]
MSFKALVYAYVIGGLTFIPVLIISLIAFTVYTSVPVGDTDATKPVKAELQKRNAEEAEEPAAPEPQLEINDLPKTRRGWLTMRRTFEETSFDGSYVTLMRSFLDSRSKDPKRSRPRDMWYVVLKGKVLYLYEDESMTECEAAIELGSHDVVIYPEGLPDGELYSKRNAICLKPKHSKGMPSVTREMQLVSENVEEKAEERSGGDPKKKRKEKERLTELERQRELARDEALDRATPWFLFVRSSVEMEDWYFSLIHASDNPANSSTLAPLQAIFSPADMNYLVSTLDEQPDVIPMRWLNALLGRIFFSYYNTDALESYIVGRLMKKLSKVKRPNFLSEIVVTDANMGNKHVTFSKPMLKELTREGDAALEMHVQYKGEMRITIKAVATISLGFKPYTVKLVLAVVLRELEGNLVVRVKRPPSNRIWYAFTHMPKMVLNVEPVVSDRQITWGMILHTIESRLKEIILESIVLPNMDDISFFDSSRFSHRGGIWPDAGRREKPSMPTEPATAEDDMSTASAPPPDMDVSTSLPTSSDAGPSHVKRSHSDGEVGVDADPQLTVPAGSSHRVTTMPESRGSSPTPTHPHPHHHWFQGHEHNHHGEDPGLLSEASLESHRPRPHHENSTSSEKSKKKRFLSVRRTTRSPSPTPSIASRASSREPSPTPSLEKPRSSSPDMMEPGSPGMDARSTKSNSSLLSTLKSRAGDRQALGHTAKETMRKWTVSWGGLKKDHADPNAGPSDEPREGRKSNKNHAAPHRTKTSYAEIRAAVDGRREQGRRNSDAPSSPIRIPDRMHKERAGSVSSIHNAHGSSISSSHAPSSPASSSAGGSVEPSADENSLSEQPPSESPTIDLNGTPTDPDELSGMGPTPVTVISPPTPVSAPPPPARPIQSQPPQGKTMTIPGIHARNRGEVMSMGYVPPSPPTPEPKSGVAGVSSVYRLWKHSPAAQSEPGGQDVERDRSRSPPTVVTSAPEASPVLPPAPMPRLTAPPLPPRTPTSSRAATSVPPAAENQSASEALKSIVSRDEEFRAASEGAQDSGSGAAQTNAATPASPKPPLPPRKIQASA